MILHADSFAEIEEQTREFYVSGQVSFIDPLVQRARPK
jgi:hypothetical protein